jgi:peroxiredoxin
MIDMFLGLRIPASFLLVALVACGGAGKGATAQANVPPNVVLRDAAGADEPIGTRAAKSKLTVLLFFSADCPVQKAHDGQIRELATKYGADGVTFYAVVSEVGADLAAERAAAKERGLDFMVLEDKNAALADALGVEYSTHSVILDHDGKVLYSGGIDEARAKGTASPEGRWLDRALDAATHGKPIAKAKTEPLGCPLRKH